MGVTAYHGALPSLINKTVLTSAAENAWARKPITPPNLRAVLYGMGSGAVAAAQSIPAPVTPWAGRVSIKVLNMWAYPITFRADANGIVFARSSRQVLNIVYLGINAKKGGFFPKKL